jgi:predicted DNA-binding antitoxin AbrB/MazE fold protein
MMDRTIPAIFDAGVFRPLSPVNLAEGTQVEIKLPVSETLGSDLVDEETKLAWNAYLDRMESLPDTSPQDGLTNRDHDRIIYGG